MRAGRLDRTITIERASETLDGHGTPVATWETVAKLRAQIIQASTEEFIRDYGASSESVVIFRTWWYPVGLADRVIYDGRAYDIKEVKEIGRRRGLEIRTVALGAA